MTQLLRFERHGARASFVELWREHTAVMRVHGQLGTDGRLRADEHPTEAAASIAFDHQLRRLENKRFMPGHHDPKMLAAIQANPDAPGPYLVYADWLLEHEDPRGELITRLSTGSRIDDLLAAHPVQLAPTWWTAVPLAPQWRLGFLERVTFRRVQDAGTVRRLLRHPSAQALRELVVQELPFAWLPTWQLALRDRPPTLRRIVLPKTRENLFPLATEIPGLVFE